MTVSPPTTGILTPKEGIVKVCASVLPGTEVTFMPHCIVTSPWGHGQGDNRYQETQAT